MDFCHPHSLSNLFQVNWVAGFDFNPAGETISTIDKYGVCLISDVNTDHYSFHLNLGNISGNLEIHSLSSVIDTII